MPDATALLSADAAPRGHYERIATLSFPAHRDFLALARLTTMHVGGLLALPVGRIADLRLAVDEACTVFLASAPPRGTASLTLSFDRCPGALRIQVEGPSPEQWPDGGEGDLGWLLLCALVGTVSAQEEAETGRGTLTLTEPLPAVP